MKAMIFAAGLGTRFKPWTDHHPKALAPVNEKSLLQRNIEYLQQYGIFEVVVNIHHFPEQMLSAIEENHGWGSTIRISDETSELLDTGGGLLNARNLLLSEEPVITLNADFLTDLDLGKLLDFHRSKAGIITLAVSKRKSSRNFLFDEERRLCGWVNTDTGDKKMAIEKPGLNLLAYSCVAVFDQVFFDLVEQIGKFSLVDAYLSLAPAHPIYGFDHTGDRLVDVGKPGSVAIAEAMFQ